MTMGRPRGREYGRCPQCTREVPLTKARKQIESHSPLVVGVNGMWVDLTAKCHGAGELPEVTS